MNMELKTERLRIIPLSLTALELLLQGVAKMEAALHLAPSGHHLEPHTQEAMDDLYRQALQRPQNYLWLTNWQIILLADNISIGSACFTGIPDEKRQVEIGYGLNEPFRGHGYMTEAVAALCEWALGQPGVTAVIAETETSNISSHQILKRNGFTLSSETAESCFWKKRNPKTGG